MVILVVRTASEPPSVRFEPLRPVSRARLILRLIYGPVLWLGAFAAAAVLWVNTWVIHVGLLVTIVSFLIGLLVLGVLRTGRRREERRYVAGD
jgi:hypothetical protein